MDDRDWYEGSCCANCHQEGCWGECPGYAEFEARIIDEERRTGVTAPIIPCTPDCLVCGDTIDLEAGTICLTCWDDLTQCVKCGSLSCDGECEAISFGEYSRRAHALATYPEEYGDFYCVMKLAGEAGEVAEKFGKRLRDADGDLRNPDFVASVIKELGDTLWYINELAHRLGMTLSEVASINLEKLESRKRRGTLHGSGDDR